MVDSIRVTTNLPQFKAHLAELGRDMERKIIRSGVAAAASVFKKHAVQLAPVLKNPGRNKHRVPGLLKRAIYTKRGKDSKPGFERYFVGVRQGRKARLRKGGNVDAFYWYFLERPEGHLARGPGQKIRGGTRRRAVERQRLRARGARVVQPYPFLAPAFQRGKDEAKRKVEERIAKRIAKANAERTRT